MTEKFWIEQDASELPYTWATTEFFYWTQEVMDILKRDVDGKLLEAAYDSVDWEGYYERLNGTPFYDWKKWGTGFLSLGGPAHIEKNRFFSAIGEVSLHHEDYLKEHPEFNQVLHDLHVEAAEQMVEFILQYASEYNMTE